MLVSRGLDSLITATAANIGTSSRRVRLVYPSALGRTSRRRQ